MISWASDPVNISSPLIGIVKICVCLKVSICAGGIFFVTAPKCEITRPSVRIVYMVLTGPPTWSSTCPEVPVPEI